MAPQVNWSKLKAELNKITDIDRLKSEVSRIGKELRKFDINVHLSPTARERLKAVESKYQEISKTLNRTQRQVDREFNRVLRNLKTQRSKAEKSLGLVKDAARKQKAKVEKASTELTARLMRATDDGVKAKSKRTASPRKRTAKAK